MRCPGLGSVSCKTALQVSHTIVFAVPSAAKLDISAFLAETNIIGDENVKSRDQRQCGLGGVAMREIVWREQKVST